MLTTQQAAEILGITRSRVLQLCKNKILKATKLGRDWVIQEGAVEGYKARGRVNQKSESDGSHMESETAPSP